MINGSVTRGVHHVGLTVADLPAAKTFFLQTLGFRQIGEKPDYPAVFVSDGTTMITLWQAADTAAAVPFDRRRNLGLHHLALRVEGVQALETLHQRLKSTAGVVVEFAPEPLGGGPTHHMMCFMPGGIRLEFIAPAA
jgi:catechol 2,3-dioxygenase-like lactoylglutathione lyase family enzyme